MFYSFLVLPSLLKIPTVQWPVGASVTVRGERAVLALCVDNPNLNLNGTLLARFGVWDVVHGLRAHHDRAAPQSARRSVIARVARGSAAPLCLR